MNPYNITLIASQEPQTEEEATLYLYGAFGLQDRQIQAAHIVPVIDNLKSWGYKSVRLRMNTPGGSPIEAMTIIEALVQSGLQVTVQIDGLLCSAGVLFLMFHTEAIDQGEIKNIMTHQASASDVRGYADDLRETADHMDKVNERMTEVLAQKTGKTSEDVQRLYLVKAKDCWMTVQQAHDEGLIDAVIPGAITSLDKIAACATCETLEDRLQMASLYTESIAAESTPAAQPFANTQIMNEIVAQLQGVSGISITAQASEQEIAAAVGRVVALNTELAGNNVTLKAENERMKSEAEQNAVSLITAKADALIDPAVDAAKLTKEQGENYKAAIISGGDKVYDNLKAVVGSLQPVQSAIGIIDKSKLSATDAKLFSMTWDEASKAGKLEAIKAKSPEHYDHLFEVKFGRKPSAD